MASNAVTFDQLPAATEAKLDDVYPIDQDATTTKQTTHQLLFDLFSKTPTDLTAVSAAELTDTLTVLQDGDSENKTETLQDVQDLFGETFANKSLPVRVVSGTTDTILAADNGGVVVYTNGSGVTITLPQQSTTVLPVGFNVLLRTAGAGAGSIVAEGSDVIVGNTGTGANATSDAGVVLRQTVSTVNTFDIFGGA